MTKQSQKYPPKKLNAGICLLLFFTLIIDILDISHTYIKVAKLHAGKTLIVNEE